jgi:uncharacterized membrane protein (DUF2068 family)
MRPNSGVYIVAVFEATKGTLVLVAGFGLLSTVSRGTQQVAEALVRHFHLNPASHYPRIFIDFVHNMSDSQLLLMAAFSFTYACVRFVEAYGLWRQMKWAKWFSVLSGGIYVPIEIYELFFGITLLKVFTLSINICIVVYMSFVLRQSRQDDAITMQTN